MTDRKWMTGKEVAMRLMGIDSDRFEKLKASGYITGNDDEVILHPDPTIVGFDLDPSDLPLDMEISKANTCSLCEEE